MITVRGRGLGLQTIDWGTLGPPDQEASQDTNFVFLTGTQMQIVPLPQNTTTDVLSLPFGVKTLGGSSAPVTALFAGIPAVTGVVNEDNSKTLNGTSGAVNTGGTPIAISGDGFSGQVLAPIEFNDAELNSFSFGTQNTFTVNSDTRISTQTVSQNPAFVDVQVCTVTGCSLTSPADQLILYPPGDPNVDTVVPDYRPGSGRDQDEDQRREPGMRLAGVLRQHAGDQGVEPTDVHRLRIDGADPRHLARRDGRQVGAGHGGNGGELLHRVRA